MRFNFSRFAKYLVHHNHEATKCVNLGAAIKETHISGSPIRKNAHKTKPGISANCAKYNKHRNSCTKLNCTCSCHLGGLK